MLNGKMENDARMQNRPIATAIRAAIVERRFVKDGILSPSI